MAAAAEWESVAVEETVNMEEAYDDLLCNRMAGDEEEEGAHVCPSKDIFM